MGSDADAPPRVGLLYDSVSDNTGDIAIGIAGVQELVRHGVDDVRILDPFAPIPPDVDLVVVGGGELIRPNGDVFYDAFRRPVNGILNAAGVWDDADDLGFLDGYEMVSARTTREAETLAASVDRVEVLPCTTTTMTSKHVDIPGVRPGEPLIGIHVVPHTFSLVPSVVEAVNAIPGRKVFLPFTHYNFDESFMRALPFDRTGAVVLPRLDPLGLHSVIGQLDLLVASSLHASIFAFSQEVPFVTVRQQKVERYFADRGLSRLVFGSRAELDAALEAARDSALNLKPLVVRDRAAVHAAYARYADVARARAGLGTSEYYAKAREPQERDLFVERLRASQRAQVVLTRDALIHSLYRRADLAEHEAARLRAQRDAEAVARAHATQQLRDVRDQLRRTPHKRLIRGWHRLLAAVRGRIRRVGEPFRRREGR